MVNPLYAVAALTCSLVALILSLRMHRSLDSSAPVDRAYLLLLNWTGFFCFCDSIWGVVSSDIIMNDTALYIMSLVFHSTAAFTPYIWLHFVFRYIGKVRYEKVWRAVTCVLVAAELVFIALNARFTTVFYIDESGIYCSVPTRKILFFIQYLTYVIIAVISTIRLLGAAKVSSTEDAKAIRKNYYAILMFVAAPIACGVFQMIYPDAPAYSIGYMLGCVIITSFVFVDTIEEKAREEIAAQAESNAKTAFLFNMSHDIRTPMNAIIGFTNRAVNHMEDREILTDSLNKLTTSGNYLLHIINDLLDMAQIESGKLELNESVHCTTDGASGIASIFSMTAAEKGITFKTDFSKVTDTYLVLDESRVSQIIANLVSNAIKYTNPGGEVSYTVEQVPCSRSGYARFRSTVRDNGHGMSPEFVKKIFNEFERDQSATKSGAQGTGLGMAIVKRLTDNMGGEISIDSELDRGTVITLYLEHRIPSQEEIAAYEKTRVETSSVDNSILTGKRVLLVDDNELNREIGQDVLTENGMLVELAESGEEALEMVRLTAERGNSRYYDFVLMDIQMPGMSGYETTMAIRNLPDPEDTHLPIIALSANAFEEDRRKSMESGLDDHVSKPIDIKVLKETMAKFIR